MLWPWQLALSNSNIAIFEFCKNIQWVLSRHSMNNDRHRQGLTCLSIWYSKQKKCLTEFFTFAEKNNLNPISTDEVFNNQEYLKSQYNWPISLNFRDQVEIFKLHFISSPWSKKKNLSAFLMENFLNLSEHPLLVSI